MKWHKGRLDNGREYMVLEYPEPPQMEIRAAEFEDDPDLDHRDELLFPYFSAVLRTTNTKPASCFALGQSPVYGVTCLRRCRTAAHYNLGIGLDPNLGAFLSLLETVEERHPKEYTIVREERLDQLDRELIELSKTEEPQELETEEAEEKE